MCEKPAKTKPCPLSPSFFRECSIWGALSSFLNFPLMAQSSRKRKLQETVAAFYVWQMQEPPDAKRPKTLNVFYNEFCAAPKGPLRSPDRFQVSKATLYRVLALNKAEEVPEAGVQTVKVPQRRCGKRMPVRGMIRLEVGVGWRGSCLVIPKYLLAILDDQLRRKELQKPNQKFLYSIFGTLFMVMHCARSKGPSPKVRVFLVGLCLHLKASLLVRVALGEILEEMFWR